MADVIFLALIVAFFALCVAFVWACDWIIGPDPSPPSERSVEPVAADAGPVR